MLNYIWAIMILAGIIYAAFTGNMEAVTNAMLDYAGEAVSLCITMTGVMCFWMGLMEAARTCGLIDKLTKGIQPFVSFMFPQLPKEHKAREYISTNIIANILGLGWACTPAGLKAMEALAELEEERAPYTQIGKKPEHTSDFYANRNKATAGKERIASNEMCTFLILNISSLQLIPVNMIAYRSQYGSVNPAAIIAPAIIATFISTLAAVLYCKVKEKSRPLRPLQKKVGTPL